AQERLLRRGCAGVREAHRAEARAGVRARRVIVPHHVLGGDGPCRQRPAEERDHEEPMHLTRLRRDERAARDTRREERTDARPRISPGPRASLSNQTYLPVTLIVAVTDP